MFKSRVAGALFLGTLSIIAAAMSVPAHAANQAPTISGQPASWVYVGSLYSFRPAASDPDSTSLKFTIVNKPAWASFSTATGQLYGTPTAVGLWNDIRIAVSDGISTRALTGFSIRATTRTNTSPVLSGSPARSALVGSMYSFQPAARDAEGDPLRFSIANRPAWATFDSLSGRLSGTPAAANVGTYSNITIMVTDGSAKVALPAFSIAVSSSSNRAPTISGTPATSVSAGQPYTFRPVAADADSDTLGFSIQNRPVWATFSSVTGQLSGTPTSTSAGTYSNIVISVSDGKASARLAAFSITVLDEQIGAASLSWEPPTTNTDGSTLTDLAGYRIMYGASPTQLTQTIQLANAGLSAFVVENLAPGTYYFAVRAYTSKGAESADSNVMPKVVR
jgi:hypothetical protein